MCWKGLTLILVWNRAKTILYPVHTCSGRRYFLMQCSRQLVPTFRHVFTRQLSSSVWVQCRLLQLWPPKRATLLHPPPLLQHSLMMNSYPLSPHLRSGFNWFGAIRNCLHSSAIASELIGRTGVRMWYQTCPSINGHLSKNSSVLFGGAAHTQTRSVVIFSKLGKRKTCKAVAKRFRRTGSGKLKFWPAGKTHNMLAKSNKARRQLRKARYVNKTQLKTLNKMISGW